MNIVKRTTNLMKDIVVESIVITILLLLVGTLIKAGLDIDFILEPINILLAVGGIVTVVAIFNLFLNNRSGYR